MEYTKKLEQVTETTSEQLLRAVQLIIDTERRQKVLEKEHQDIRKEYEDIREEYEILKNKVESVISSAHYFSILGYVNTLDYTESIDLRRASSLGKKAEKLSKKLGYMIKSAPDIRFGRVNAYHEDILEKIFNKE